MYVSGHVFSFGEFLFTPMNNYTFPAPLATGKGYCLKLSVLFLRRHRDFQWKRY